MADHIRTQFRQAVALACTGLATTGANVFESRAYRVAEAELPALRIYVSSEDAVPATIHGPALVERRVTIVVEGIAKALSDLDDRLDDISKEVEAALGSSVTVGSVGVPVSYAGCELSENDEGELPTGSVAMRFEATLFNLANVPDVLT